MNNEQQSKTLSMRRAYDQGERSKSDNNKYLERIDQLTTEQWTESFLTIKFLIYSILSSPSLVFVFFGTNYNFLVLMDNLSISEMKSDMLITIKNRERIEQLMSDRTVNWAYFSNYISNLFYSIFTFTCFCILGNWLPLIWVSVKCKHQVKISQ